MSYRYEYPRPALTVDVVLFTVREEALHVLLIERGSEPLAGRWALPGGFVNEHEDLETAARRELEEETGARGLFLEQLYTFGEPGRDPRGHVVSVAYYALAPSERFDIHADTDAADARWHPMRDLPGLAFDHARILAMAHQRLVAKLSYSTAAFQFLPPAFTLSDVQALYEVIGEEPRDKRNFRKWLLGLDLVEPTGEKRRGPHRPAALYRLRRPDTVTLL
jgi:8-oxo-dGTP diphosphatase